MANEFQDSTLLKVNSLSVRLGDPQVKAVDSIDFTIDKGEVLGIAGESGSGKSVTALSLTRLLPGSANPEYSGDIQLRTSASVKRDTSSKAGKPKR